MSNTMVIRYTTRPEAAEENRKLVADVFAELAEKQPSGFRYAAYCLEDGVSFVHVFTSETDGPTLGQLDAFNEFQNGIGDRVEAPPVAAKAIIIGQYQGS